ncbi:MAG: hypothetical protein FJX20_12075 [Alphaproteobacteria bacterium]|nr:hypothetical protein [Alphaproteobacteria bacterium]
MQMQRWVLALAAGVLAVGLSATAGANEVVEYCQTSIGKDPAAKTFPDVPKFCGCIGEKVAAADRSLTVTVMKASDEARAKGGRLDPATLPPEQAKALEGLRGVVQGCMQLVMTPAPAPAPTPVPAPAAKVTGIAAWSQLIGNTVAGKIDGKDYAEFYLADGTVKTMEDSVLTTGKWSVEGDQVCFVYPKEDKACFAVEVAGDDVTFTEKSGTGIRLKILKGNPRNL